MVTTNQKPTKNIQRIKRKESLFLGKSKTNKQKYTKVNHQITREENKRRRNESYKNKKKCLKWPEVCACQ